MTESDLANRIWTFYETLTRKGLTREQAFELTRMYADSLFRGEKNVS